MRILVLTKNRRKHTWTREETVFVIFFRSLHLETDPIPIASLFLYPYSFLQTPTCTAVPPQHQLTLQVQGSELFSDELLINNNKKARGTWATVN